MAQIGTIKLATENNGTVSVPVFDTADSTGSNVYDMVRVEGDGVTGFIPFTDTSDAAYPYLRVQSQNHGVLAAHDSTVTEVIIDDFEDGDVSEYTALDQNTGPSSWSAVTGTVESGSYSGEMYADGTFDGWYASESSGLNYTPVEGDTFRWHWYTNTADGVVKMNYGRASGGGDVERYSVDMQMRNDEVRITDSDGAGTTTTVSSTAYSNWSVGEWYTVEVDWTSTTHTVTLYDSGGSQLAQTSGDPSLASTTSGAIALWWGYFDVIGYTYFDTIQKV